MDDLDNSKHSGIRDLSSKRLTVLGLSKEEALKGLFGGNAFVSIIVLSLITIFLFKEGFGFFGQYRDSLALHRQSGLEYVELMRQEQEALSALNRYLNSIRSLQSEKLSEQGLAFTEVKKALSQHEDFYNRFEDLALPLLDVVLDGVEIIAEARDSYLEMLNLMEYRENMEKQGMMEESASIVVEEVDLRLVFDVVRAREAEFVGINRSLKAGIQELLSQSPRYEDPELDARMERFKELSALFLDELPAYEAKVLSWNMDEPIGLGDAITSFLFGKNWVTNSSIQDWYGILPLFSGSILVAIVAMGFAIPLGVGSAIYVNQVAKPLEQNIIKPYIEFISAIPSVVIGFFGIAVFGTLVRKVSEWDALSWIGFFPVSERLTAFTAGSLLALMAIPTIFTLAEDALNNVPIDLREASMSMGATKLQTIVRIIVPTALSGIVSAVLLGFGRVIGETMVVLLCAGNRIQIPPFAEGIGVVFEPVHTMTGIIAQELGEVVNGSIHYRALFMVGLVLFLLSLIINYLAQKIVMKFQIKSAEH
jgi:phosphate transport system permease protein